MAEGDIEAGIGEVTDRVAGDFNAAHAPPAAEPADEYEEAEPYGSYEDDSWDAEPPQEGPEGYEQSYHPQMTVEEALQTPEAGAYFEQEAQQQALQQEAQEVLGAEAAQASYRALGADALREARVPTEGPGAIDASLAGEVMQLMLEQRGIELVASGLTIEQAQQVMLQEDAVGQEYAAIGEEAKKASNQQQLNHEFVKWFPNAANNPG